AAFAPVYRLDRRRIWGFCPAAGRTPARVDSNGSRNMNPSDFQSSHLAPREGNIALQPAIDVHGHYGQYKSTAEHVFRDSLYSGDAAEVVRRASAVNIVLTIVSPLSALLPRFRADAVAGNAEAARVVAQTPGLAQYVVIDPRRAETFAQAE